MQNLSISQQNLTQNLSINHPYLIQNLSIDQQFIIAQTLISLFAISFIIFFGFATYFQMHERYISRPPRVSIHLFSDYKTRLLVRQQSQINICILFLFSIFFSMVSLLSLLYFLLGNVKLLVFALHLGIFSVICVILFILSLVINSFKISREEIEQIIEYLPKEDDENIKSRDMEDSEGSSSDDENIKTSDMNDSRDWSPDNVKKSI